jgi:chemotaxis protein MotB
MSRKAKHEEHANHERWLVSYSDFITLMFAFFVVMFASSQSDKTRAKAVSDSVTKALQEGRVSAAVAAVLGGTVDDKGVGNAAKKGPGGSKQDLPKVSKDDLMVVDLLPSLTYLNSELKQEIAAGKLQVRLESRGLIVSLTEAAFFTSGEDEIHPGAYGSIAKIAEAVKRLPNAVRLEGNTDSVPIHNARFRNNWELSAARAIAMLQLLVSRFEVAEHQLAVVGYADTNPIEANDSDANRARNRRVDIVILTKAGAKVEPNAGKVEPSPAQPGLSKPSPSKSAPAQAAPGRSK